MAAIDNYPLNSKTDFPELYAPLYYAALCTPSDSTDISNTSRGISFGTAGALQVTMAGMSTGTSIVIPSGALSIGVIHPLRVTRIWNASTTAGSIVFYW